MSQGVAAPSRAPRIMDLEGIRTFVRAVQAGSFAAARLRGALAACTPARW
jgi:hypothetical protein